MRTFALLALSIALVGYAHAQPTFMKIFRATGTAKGNLNELSSGNLRVGISWQSGTSLLDPLGNIIQSHNYAIDTFLVLQAIEQYSDSEYFFAGAYYKDSCTVPGLGTITRMYPVIGRMDSLGNILSAHHYILNSPSCSNGAGDLEVLSDHSVIAWGRDAMFFALKADATGAPVWAKRFDYNAGFEFFKELPGGDLLAGINMNGAGAVVARLDPDGNILWCKSYIRPRGMVNDCLIESNDSFIITGYTDSLASTNVFEPIPPDYHPKLFLMNLDGSGDVQWCKGYDSAPHLWYVRRGSPIVKTQDGNYVILANLAVIGYNDSFRPFLMKTDVNGDTLWTRSQGRTDYTYETISLLAYSDGGLFYYGRIWGDLPEPGGNFAYLYKTDSLGHLPCDERHHPVDVSDLFPTDSSFVLTSIDGAIALPASIHDTMYAPITQYDGCTFLPTGMPPTTRKPEKPRVYPNPTTGHFTVQFSDPLMAESYYSVYDAMGRLLYQRPLPTGATAEEIDLSRFSKGTYVIKLTDPDGVCFERVVLE